MTVSRVASSFRDPSGFLFTRQGTLLRQVQPTYAPHYELLKSSGLYDALVSQRLLVLHEERPLDEAASPCAAYVLRPERIPYVSMPYEWCFSQLRAADLDDAIANGIKRNLPIEAIAAEIHEFAAGIAIGFQRVDHAGGFRFGAQHTDKMEILVQAEFGLQHAFGAEFLLAARAVRFRS